MRSRTARWCSIAVLAAIWALCQTSLSPAAGPKKVAVLPFAMNADRDLTFLQTGIVDMLHSRLAWKGEVEVIEKGAVKKEMDAIPGPLDKEKAVKVGRALGADFVILGSLTVFGESVSIDAKILDVAKSEELVTAFDQSKGMDGVIPTVNQFAEDINAKIMGREIRRPEGPAQERQRASGPLTAGGEEGSEAGQRPSHVQRFKVEIRGLALGDVDGDGKTEMVMIDKDTVYVYKWVKSRLSLFKEVKGTWSPNFIYLSVTDQDGNGVAEIYVSNLTATGATVYALEWKGNTFAEFTKRDSWLIRVVDLPGRGNTLVGQKRAADGNYVGDVQILKRQGDGFTASESLNLPRYGNVFNFVQSKLDGKGGIFTTLLDPYEHLMVFNSGGERLWRSDDYFGGSLAYMEYMDVNANDMAQTAVRVFIPSPIYLYDVNGDGREEIVICQNHSKVARIFGDFRWFGSGKVHFLDWDGAGLTSKWVSPKITGSIVGYQIGDLDHDSLPELVVASVTSESYFVGRPKSQVLVFDLK